MPSKAAGSLPQRTSVHVGGPGLALRVALFLVSALIFLGTGELALRLMFPGGGRMTLGAPGYPVFEHVNVHDQQRGRLEWGPKREGVPRVMILGDSITWGTGIRQWQDTWPEQFAIDLEQAGRPHELAVLSLPGREIDAHVEQLKIWGQEVQPDALVYQWYVNDLEVIEHRPSSARRWHQFPWHEPLRRASYLYYFIDNRLQMLLPPPERSYVDYILTDFIPGSIEWTEFERLFHGLATRAREIAPIRVLMLYPQVPFTPPYPLQAIHDRMKALAKAESLSIPPASWTRSVGAIVPKPDARWKQAVRLPARSGRQAIVTRGYYAKGSMDVTIVFSCLVPHGEIAATVEAIDLEKQTTLVSAPLAADDAPGGLWTAHLSLTLPDDAGHDVQIAIGDTTVELDVASIDLRVDYGFDVLDLTDTMNTFDTHVSIFDAHPSPRAHKVLGDAVARELTRLEQVR